MGDQQRRQHESSSARPPADAASFTDPPASRNDAVHPQPRENDMARRDFIKEAGALAGVSAAAHLPLGAQEPRQAGNNAIVARQSDDKPSKDSMPDPQKLTVSFKLNQKPITLQIDSRTTLLDLLREQLHLTGTKKGCDQGACGACTVLINEQRELACLTLAATLQGKHVTTIEGVARGEQLHPMQAAFLRCDAFQCGYCTPGQIMSALGCVREGHANQSVEETREWMSGNLCRCSAYPNIVAAVRQAAGVGEPVDPVISVERFAVSQKQGDS